MQLYFLSMGNAGISCLTMQSKVQLYCEVWVVILQIRAEVVSIKFLTCFRMSSLPLSVFQIDDAQHYRNF